MKFQPVHQYMQRYAEETERKNYGKKVVEMKIRAQGLKVCKNIEMSSTATQKNEHGIQNLINPRSMLPSQI